MPSLVDVLRQLGARPAERRADAPLVLDGTVLGLESLFGGPLSGEVAVASQSSESIVFERPLELAACGTLWMPDVEDADTFREAVADAHATLGARLETDLRTLSQLGFDAVLDAPRPRAIATFPYEGHELTVAIGVDGELALVRVDGMDIADAEGRALAAPEEVDGAAARAAVGRVLARLIDSGAVFAADSLDVDINVASDEHESDERRPTSVMARASQGTVPLSEEELGELNAALDDEGDEDDGDGDGDDGARQGHAARGAPGEPAQGGGAEPDVDAAAGTDDDDERTNAVSAVSQIDVDIADEDGADAGSESTHGDDEEEPEPTQAVEPPTRRRDDRRAEEATRAEEEPSVDAQIAARAQAQQRAARADDEGSLADAFDDEAPPGDDTNPPRADTAPPVDADSVDDEPEPTVTALAPAGRQGEEARAAEPDGSSLLDAFDDDDAPGAPASPAAETAWDDDSPRTDLLARPGADESRTAAVRLSAFADRAGDDAESDASDPSNPPTQPVGLKSPLAAIRDAAGAAGTADDDPLASDPPDASGAAEVSDQGGDPDEAASAAPSGDAPPQTREVSAFGDVVVDVADDDDAFDSAFDSAGEADGFDDGTDRTRAQSTRGDERGAPERRDPSLPLPADTAAWVAPPIAASGPVSATLGDDVMGAPDARAATRPPDAASPPATATHAPLAMPSHSIGAAEPPAAHERHDERDLAVDAAGFDDGDDFEDETVSGRPDDQKTRAVFVQDAMQALQTRAIHTASLGVASTRAADSAVGPSASEPAVRDDVVRAPAVSDDAVRVADAASVPAVDASADEADPGALEARAAALEAEARALRDRAGVIRASRLPQPAAPEAAASAPPAQASVESSSLPSLASVDVEAVDEETFAANTADAKTALGAPLPAAARRAALDAEAARAAADSDNGADKGADKSADKSADKLADRGRAAGRQNPEDLFEGVSFAEVQAALREQEARNAQTQLAAPELGEIPDVSDSGDVFGNMSSAEGAAPPQPPVTVEPPRAVGLVVEDARARDRLKKRLEPRIADLVEAADVHAVSALPMLRELAAVVFVRPRTDERTLEGIALLARLEDRPRILVLSSDASFDRVSIDLRVALGERASEVAQQVLDGLERLGVPLTEATEP